VIVLDASTLTDFLLGRQPALDALSRALLGREQETLHAPDLVEPEVLDALRKLAMRGAVTGQRASEAVADLASTRLIRYPHAPLRVRVWELRHDLSAYDATYLALAEAFDDPLLLTGDGALAGRARQSLGEDRVRHVH